MGSLSFLRESLLSLRNLRKTLWANDHKVHCGLNVEKEGDEINNARVELYQMGLQSWYVLPNLSCQKVWESVFSGNTYW